MSDDIDNWIEIDDRHLVRVKPVLDGKTVGSVLAVELHRGEEVVDKDTVHARNPAAARIEAKRWGQSRVRITLFAR